MQTWHEAHTHGLEIGLGAVSAGETLLQRWETVFESKSRCVRSGCLLISHQLESHSRKQNPHSWFQSSSSSLKTWDLVAQVDL